MSARNAAILSGALVVSALIWAAAILTVGRYVIMEPAGSNVAWKIDRLTGQAYGCERSQFGPFCIPAPDRAPAPP